MLAGWFARRYFFSKKSHSVINLIAEMCIRDSGWVFVANLIASAVTFNVILLTTDRTVPRIDRRLLAAVLVYSLPLLVSGVAGTDVYKRQEQRPRGMISC